MPALCQRLNFRNVELYDDTKGQTVGVKLSCGNTKQVRWLGFVDREEATRIGQAIPVKLAVVRYTNSDSFDWTDLAPGEFVQGCLTPDGVYAVTIASVRIVSCDNSDLTGRTLSEKV